MYDIIIIGSGPAGLSAGIYGVRAGKKVLVLEANQIGGKLSKIDTIANYPGFQNISGEELSNNFYEQAMGLGVEIKLEKAMSIMNDGVKKIVQTLDNIYECKTIILATGIDKRELRIPGEKEFNGRGVSYCAICDGNFFKNKDVMIVCGSEESLHDALYLSGLCNKVYAISYKDMNISQLDKENIVIMDDATVLKINGNTKVESVTLNVSGKEEEFKVSGVFVAIANVPETSNLLNNLDVLENGSVLANEDLKTSQDGIFVAGDLRNKNLRQVVTAVSDGAIAATQAIKYINEMKAKNFILKIYKKNMINETNILVDNDVINYSSITKVPGQEEIVERKNIDNKDVINDLIENLYNQRKDLLIKVFNKVNNLDKVTRSKNTAINDLTIMENGNEMKFDCYIQEYENMPSLFTVEVEKYVMEKN